MLLLVCYYTLFSKFKGRFYHKIRAKKDTRQGVQIAFVLWVNAPVPSCRSTQKAKFFNSLKMTRIYLNPSAKGIAKVQGCVAKIFFKKILRFYDVVFDLLCVELIKNRVRMRVIAYGA